MQLGVTDVSKALALAMRNGTPLLPRDELPNAKWRIALGKASQVANEVMIAVHAAPDGGSV